MSEQQGAYRQILKVTSLFGGVQVIQILLAVLRSKAVAVLLGPAGMGVGGLYASTTAMIASLTGLGLQVSAVRDIAAAHGSGDAARVGAVATTVRRLVWATGGLGLLVTLVGSPWLSELSFADRDHTLGFAALSLTLLFGALASGQLVLLQGMRHLGALAKANVYGAALGLLVAVPLYWALGEGGIVPAMLAGSALGLLVAWLYGRRVQVARVALTLRQTLSEGRLMVAMGVAVMLNGLLLGAVDYGIRVAISHGGGAVDVGLYSAGFGIMNSYVGMIFNAMLTDYFPRLSAVVHDRDKCAETIGQQADLAVLIVAPILLCFLVFVQLAVLLLYSEKFLAIEGMMQWAALGILWKAASWPIGFVFVPKGDTRLFIVGELVMNAVMLGLHVALYRTLGLEGLGLAYLLTYVLYFGQVVALARWRYGFRYSSTFLRLFAVQAVLALGCFVVMRAVPRPYAYVAGVGLIAVSAWHAGVELDRRVGLRGIWHKLKARLGR